jgi:hypothetical protein
MKRRIDFNTLLKAGNLFVAILLAVAYGLIPEQGTEYADRTTVVLALLLALQTHVVLVLEARRRDPFVLLLAMTLILYYQLRIVTLSLIPFSIVFDRYPYSPADSNFALTFILIANVFLYAGLYCARFHGNESIDETGWRAGSTVPALALMVATLVLHYFSGNYWTAADTPRVISVLASLLSPTTVVLMAIAYCMLYRKSLSRMVIMVMVALIVLEMAAHTLWGSRSAIIGFVQNFIVIALALAGSIKLSKRFVALAVVLLPAAVFMMGVVFAISTFNRLARETGDNALDVGRSIDVASESAARLTVGRGLLMLLPPIASRAGFFDFSAEIIAHREEYASVLNGSTYWKSMVDNIVTPGFDVYDQPKVANSLLFIYRDWGKPSRRSVADYYHSDQLGIYGEFYALFGYLSLPLMFGVAFLLKRVYVGLTGANPFILAIKRIIVLLIFVRTIDSFGLDWTVGEIVLFAVVAFLYTFFFVSRRVRALPPAPEPAPPLRLEQHGAR